MYIKIIIKLRSCPGSGFHLAGTLDYCGNHSKGIHVIQRHGYFKHGHYDYRNQGDYHYFYVTVEYFNLVIEVNKTDIYCIVGVSYFQKHISDISLFVKKY